MMKGLGTAAASAAVILLSGAGGAYAADLGTYPVKAVPVAGPATCTSIMDFFSTACQVSAYGIRFYGTIDVGFGYMTNGSPMDKLAGPGVQYFLGKNSTGGRWNYAPNGLSLSNVGFQIKEPLGAGWSFVGQVESQFNPLGLGHLASSPGSVQENLGLSLNNQLAPGDGAGNGKFYNGLGFAGVSNDTWGTLTFGRQNTLMKDGILAYDAMNNSYSVSYIGYFGATSGGGDTEDGKSTTAVKYRVNFGNWHFGAMTQIGGYEAGNASQAIAQGNIGADYHVGPGILSGEIIGGYTKGAVSEALSIPSLSGFPGIPNPNAATTLGVTISDNTNLMLLAKYTVDKLKLYAGYEWMQLANPADPVTSFTDITGQPIVNGGTLNGFGVKINNAAFANDKVQQIAWTGAKYSLTSSVDVAAAYYHTWQNDFSAGAFGTAGAVSQNCAQNSRALGSCAGTTDAVSFLVDWQFAPKWDTYLATAYSKQTGGMVSGFESSSNWSTNAGVRFRW
jgi:predicted porin